MNPTDPALTEERLAIAERILRDCAARAGEALRQHPDVPALRYCAEAYDRYLADARYEAAQQDQQLQITDE